MIKEKILKNKTPLILAVVLSFLMIWPYLHFITALGGEFKGILPPVIDDELFYSARIQDVFDGYPTISNAYLFEHKNSLSIQFLSEYLLAQPLKVFGLTVIQGRFLYNLVLPALSFLLTYSAFYLIIKSRFWSVIFSSFLFFGLYLNIFLRPVSPQLNFIFWLTQFIFLWKLIKNGFSRKILTWNTVNLGLLFYVYPYYLNFYFISRTSEYGETITRIGLISSRFPSGMRVVLGALVLLTLFAIALKFSLIQINIPALFFAAGLLATIISSNSHIITGKNLEFSSHYRMLSVFFFSFSFAYLWRAYLGLNPGYKKTVSLALVIIVLFTVVQNVRAYVNRYSAISSSEEQEYALLFDWLNKNTPKDSVVYANDTLSNLIPVYASNDVFYSENANLFLVADDEILTRFILNNFFETLDREFVIKNSRAVYRVRYADIYGHAVQGNKLRRLLKMKTVPELYLPEDAINNVLSRANQIKNSDLEKELKKYRLDYILWDKNKNPEWRFGNHKFVSKLMIAE